MESLGDALRSLRAGAGLTQDELANRAELSTRTISDIERGLRTRLYPVTAERLGVALGLTRGECDEFVRQARGRTAGTPGLDLAFRKRFVGWYGERVADIAKQVGNEEHWYDLLDADSANLTVALRWAAESGDADSFLDLAVDLWQYWMARGALAEGREWLERGLAMEPSASAAKKAQAFWGLAWLSFQEGDDDATTAAAAELRRLAVELDSPLIRRNALTVQGIVALAADRPVDASQLFEAAHRLAREAGQPWVTATSDLNRGIAGIATGDLDRAATSIKNALAAYRKLGDERFSSRCLGYLGLAALSSGHQMQARHYFIESLDQFESLGEPSGTAEALTGLAAVAASSGDGVRAAQLSGAAERLREAHGFRALPVERRFAEGLLAAVRADMDPQDWAAAWTAGRAFRLNEATALARTWS